MSSETCDPYASSRDSAPTGRARRIGPATRPSQRLRNRDRVAHSVLDSGRRPKHSYSTMHPTKHDLSEAARRAVAELLNVNLADAIDLAMQAKQAHWNVKGPDFYALHKLFDEVAEGIQSSVDDLAERVAQLGGFAEGTIGAVKGRSRLPEYPLTITDGRDHIHALRESLASFARTVRVSIDAATEARDADTADLFTEVSRAADKYLWLVGAHLQSQK